MLSLPIVECHAENANDTAQQDFCLHSSSQDLLVEGRAYCKHCGQLIDVNECIWEKMNTENVCAWHIGRECMEGSCCCEPFDKSIDEDNIVTAETCLYCGSHDLFYEDLRFWHLCGCIDYKINYCGRCGKLIDIVQSNLCNCSLYRSRNNE